MHDIRRLMRIGSRRNENWDSVTSETHLFIDGGNFISDSFFIKAVRKQKQDEKENEKAY